MKIKLKVGQKVSIFHQGNLHKILTVDRLTQKYAMVNGLRFKLQTDENGTLVSSEDYESKYSSYRLATFEDALIIEGRETRKNLKATNWYEFNDEQVAQIWRLVKSMPKK